MIANKQKATSKKQQHQKLRMSSFWLKLIWIGHRKKATGCLHSFARKLAAKRQDVSQKRII